MSESETRAPNATAGRAGARGARQAGPLRRALRLAVTGPGKAPPGPRAVVYILTAAGAAALVWSGVIHLRLWADGYSVIPKIGPLFMTQGIGVIVLAAILVLSRFLVVMAIGAVTLVGTATGLLISVNVTLFGFRELIDAPYVQLSMAVEFSGAGILLLAGVILGVTAWGATAGKPGR